MASSRQQSGAPDDVTVPIGQTFPEIRQAVRALCERFPGAYWRDLDRQRAYPTAFVAALTEAGYLAALIPESYGGSGLPLSAAGAILEEIHLSGGNAAACHAQMYIMGTLLRHGSEEQKKTHLPAVAKGEIQWCQGYSEPESGSDLASLSTRAVRDGDDLVINGAKVWTTMAHRADWIMLLTRTDPDAPKHRGISFVLVDMKSPGVSVRPIINMSGGHEFNQVTFDDVRVPRANVVGEEDRGWYVAVTLLDFERSGIDYSASARRLLDDTKEFATETKRNGVPIIEIPWVRSLLADRYIECEVARLMAYNVAYMQSQDLIPTKEASMSKGFGSETVQRVTEASLDILGMYGTLGREEKWAPLKGRVQEHWMNAFAGTIAAGTSEIQRNIIAGRGLGLPRG